MADGLFDHSGKNPRIQNPMRFFGAMKVVRGVVITLLAGSMLAAVAEHLKIHHILGYVTAALGFILMGYGIRDIAKGFQAGFRLFVGRTLPISLAFNTADTESSNAKLEKKYLEYNAQGIHDQLKKGVNTSFVEPTGWMANLLASLYPNYILQPRPIRGVMLGAFLAASKTIVALVVMLIIWFVSVSGLAGETGGFVKGASLLILSLYVAYVWSNVGYDDTISSNVHLARAFSLAILVPIATGYGYQQLTSRFFSANDYQLAELFGAAYGQYFNDDALFIMVIVFSVMVMVQAVLLLVTRPNGDTKVEVTERIENSQSNFEPQDLLNNMNPMVWNHYREEKIPNRVYCDQQKTNRLSDNKYKVKYDHITESQPTYKTVTASTTNRIVRAIAAIGFAVIGTCSVAVLYYGLAHFTGVFSNLSWLNSNDPRVVIEHGVHAVVGTGAYVVYAWVLMKMSSGVRCILLPFISEIHWESRVMSLEHQLSVSESMQRSGNQLHDSYQTENVVSRCSLTTSLWAAKIQSTSFVNIYGKGLRSPRVIMSFHEDADSANLVFEKIKSFIDSRSNIVTVAQSKNDLRDSMDMNALNSHSKVSNTAPSSMVAAALINDNNLNDTQVINEAAEAGVQEKITDQSN